MDVTVIVESRVPDIGTHKYAAEVAKIKGIKNIINFSDALKTNGIVNKLLNLIYRRRAFLEKNAAKLGSVVHFTQPEIAFSSKALADKNVILTVHDLAIFGFMKVTNFYNLIRASLFRKRFSEIIKRADVIMVNSSQTKNELIDTLDVEERKIRVVHHGVDKSLRPLNKATANVIGYLGGFNKRKRVDKLLEDFVMSGAWKEYQLWVYGNPDGEFKRIRKKFGSFPSIKFNGRITEADKNEVLNRFKYFVFPTSYEGLGLPILEAIAAGVPTFVYSDAKLPNEVYRYPIKIRRLNDIFRQDYKKLKREFENKSKTVKREFSWDKMRREIVAIYRMTLAVKRHKL